MSSPLISVVTTIQQPTPSLRRLASSLSRTGSPLIVIGDKKGPAGFALTGADLVSLAEQLQLPFSLARLLPTGHYARKNLGYLIAMQRAAAVIYETDDDNAPGAAWAPRTLRVEARPISRDGWFNVYRWFSKEPIWPRGFPLRLVRDEATFRRDEAGDRKTVESPIQQGLADGSPDVDAVWRLVLDREIRFQAGDSIQLMPGTWCPFNSQSTWWWPVAYPLMYLPSHCSFRMTDIWRSFIAQRCLWELGHGVVFHAPEVTQERNPHNLLRDFEDEVPGYLRNEELVVELSWLGLKPSPAQVGSNLLRCYERLVGRGFFPADEIRLVRAWLRDLSVLRAWST